MMKKIITTIGTIFAVFLFCFSVNAIELNKKITVDVSGKDLDYVTFTAVRPGVNAKFLFFTQSSDFLNKVQKIEVVPIKAQDETVSFEFNISNDDPKGEYTVAVTYTKADSSDQEFITVHVADDNEINSAIQEIWKSDEPIAKIKDYVIDKELFWLDIGNSDEIEGFNDYYKAIRTEMYSEMYTDLSDIQENIVKASVLYELLSSNAINLQAFLETYPSSVSEYIFDFGNGADSDALKKNACDYFIKNRDSINSLKSAGELLKEAICISYFSVGTNKEKAEQLEKFADNLEIDISGFKKNNISLTEAVKYISGKTKDEIRSSCQKALKTILDERNRETVAGEKKTSGGSKTYVSNITQPIETTVQDKDNIAENDSTTNQVSENAEEKTGNRTIKYDDIKDDFWAADHIYFLADKHIVSGDEGKFRPQDKITRAEFVKLVVTAFNIPQITDNTLPFDDCNISDWYFPHIHAAYKAGIISGISNNFFGAKNSITRQDAAVIIGRAMDSINEDENGEVYTLFNDDWDIEEYAKGAVKILSENKIINGYPDNSFRPRNNITRVEAAEMIYNAYIAADIY